MKLGVLVVVLALIAIGCQPSSDSGTKTGTVSAPVAANSGKADGWVLSTNDGTGGAPALLWNGLIGVRVARTGGGLDYDGKPLGFYMIDEYEPSGEEKIRPMPNPILVTWTLGNELFDSKTKATHNFLKSGGTPLDPRQGTDYVQSLDMRTGILTTSWRQKVGDVDATVSCDTVVHPTKRVLAQRWSVACSKPTTFSIKTLDYSGPNDMQESFGTDSSGNVSLSASPQRVVAMGTNLYGATVGALSRAGGFRIQEGTTTEGKPVLYDRVLSFGPHSAKPLPMTNPTALKALVPTLYSYNDVAAAAKSAWADRWKTDIVIDGPVEDQQAVRSFLFYLTSAIAPEAKRAISPFGLSNDRYFGHVFWDADVWVLPALALLAPEEAKAISDYRVARGPQAVKNFSEWWGQGCPTASGPLGNRNPNGVHLGIKFPWESSETGKETCPGPSRFEEHVTGSVMWGLTQAEALGLEPRQSVDDAAALAAGTYMAMVAGNPPYKGPLSIKGVVSPDENHTGDNDLYTNLLAEWLNNGRRFPANPHPAFVIPQDTTSLLTYEGDQLRGYKQAAAILSIYPLQYPGAEAEDETMMDRFPDKVIKNGPAMSDSLNALIWARMGDRRAYDTWKTSWEDFTKNPLMLFSEKRMDLSPTYFTTGAAGSLQAVLYGFLGFRIDLKNQAGAAWSHMILGGNVLSVKPQLPAAWKSVTLKNFQVLGSHYTLTATHAGCSVTQGD